MNLDMNFGPNGEIFLYEKRDTKEPIKFLFVGSSSMPEYKKIWIDLLLRNNAFEKGGHLYSEEKNADLLMARWNALEKDQFLYTLLKPMLKYDITDYQVTHGVVVTKIRQEIIKKLLGE